MTETPESTEVEEPGSVFDAAQNGDRLDVLVAMRDRIARDLDNPATSARDVSSLSRRLLEILRDIEAIEEMEDEEHDVVTQTPDEEFDPESL